jgi:hypothetical protein
MILPGNDIVKFGIVSDVEDGGDYLPKIIHINRDWLYDKYINEKLSVHEIGILCNADGSTIWKRLIRYNIPRRTAAETKSYNFPKQLLHRLYIKERKNTYQIAKELECSAETVSNYLKLYDIPIRSSAEANTGDLHWNWKGGTKPYCVKFNNTFKQYIRKKFDNTCFICGKSSIEDGNNLCVHHIDYNKNAICNGKEWAFVPLCRSCHTKTNYNRYYYFNLLINYWVCKYTENFIYDIDL